VHGAHAIALGQVPIELDVGQHELLGKCAPLEIQAKPFADHAVGAVAPDQVLGHNCALASPVANGRYHLCVVLREVEELDASLHVRAQVCQ
jgi:hypothetical protein